MELEHTIYADWAGHYVKLTWLPGNRLPDLKDVTSIHGVCMEQGKVLLVYVANRGFNLPGGHVEGVEGPEETLLRECMEEGYVKCDSVSLIGMVRVSHEDNPLFDVNGKYPLIGYQLFYRANVVECLPYRRESECTTRIWVEPEEVPYVTHDQELSRWIVEEALKSI